MKKLKRGQTMIKDNLTRVIIFWGAFMICLAGLGIISGLKPVFGDLKPAPDLKLQDLEGNKFKLSDHKGKVVLVNFWAVWCPPCKTEIPHLIKLYNRYKDQGLIILGIAIKSKEGTIKKLVKELGINYPIINGDNPHIIRSFPGIRAVPTSFIINREGNFYNNYVGFNQRVAVQVEEDIKTLLNQ